MAEIVDHFVDENGTQIDIVVIDHDNYVGLDANRKLMPSQQPTVYYLEELPSTQGNANLFIDIARYMLDED